MLALSAAGDRKGVKINIGCGRKILAGWVNTDIQARDGVDHVCDLRAVPLPDECADVVQAMHVIEHVYRWEAPDALREWRRLLKPGGLLILELPDLEHACRNLLRGRGDQMAMWPLYGDPGPMDVHNCHRWGYTRASIASLLAAEGFRRIEHLPPQTHGRRLDRDMRVEAIK